MLTFACNNAKSTSDTEPLVSNDTIVANKKQSKEIIPGDARIDQYLEKIKGKKVGLVVNKSAIVGNTHLVDTLLSRGITISKIFAPEHGFRGDADAGEKVSDYVDEKTGIPIISIYGKTRKPSPKSVNDIDVMVFDIQDVGIRFYTYISTMHYVMETCAENNIEMIVLDRPNPNGDYVDGAVLDIEHRSFVGMHPIPVIHGCTVGELAKMINGEKWLKNKITCDLTVVECENYTHQSQWSLKVKPSPNLPNDLSIRLYPSLCFFEPTQISIGRGTYFPFQLAGYPDSLYGDFEFTPQSIEGMSKYPKHKNKKCYGIDFRNETLDHRFTLKYLVDFYSKFPAKNDFFTNESFFNKLAGNDILIEQIKKGLSEKEIRETWKTGIDNYLIMRSKYLLYPDKK